MSGPIPLCPENDIHWIYAYWRAHQHRKDDSTEDFVFRCKLLRCLRELMLRQTPRTLSELAAQVVVAAGGGIGPDCAHGGYIADGAFLQTLTLMAEDGE